MGGHMGASKTYNNENDSTTGLVCSTGYVHSPLIVGLAKTTNQSLNTETRYHWKKDKTRQSRSEQSILIRRAPFHLLSKRNLHCLLVIDAFSRLLMVNPIINTGAQATVSAVEKWIHSFRNPQSIVLDRAPAFINTEFINWTKKRESLYDLEQHTRLGQMAKLKPKINTLPAIGGTFWTTPGITGFH